MKKIYLVMCANSLAPNHIRQLKEAAKLGEITVGLLSDSLFSNDKTLEMFDYEQRQHLIQHVAEVKHIIPQDSWDLTDTLQSIKPDYVGLSYDCSVGSYYRIKQQTLETIQQWHGQWFDYEKITLNSHEQEEPKTGITVDARRSSLRKLIESHTIVRTLEVHNALSGLIVENVSSKDFSNNTKKFQAMWSSSLTDSTAKGKPDIEVVDLTSRLTTVQDIFEVTTKPMLFDADTGGKIEHFVFTVKTLERAGISAVVIEDKVGLKKNSLLGNDVTQLQADPKEFSKKISAGKAAQVTKDFMIIARIESLILEKGMEDTLARADAYIQAGADAILIHSRDKTPDEIFTFCEFYNQFTNKVPLVVVPSSYNIVTEQQLAQAGVNVVIYANHLLRAAYPSMIKVAESILTHGRSAECENDCLSIKEILELIPGTK